MCEQVVVMCICAEVDMFRGFPMGDHIVFEKRRNVHIVASLGVLQRGAAKSTEHLRSSRA